MSKKTIFKGFHRPIGLPAFLAPMGFLRKKLNYTFKRKVTFFENCAYDLKNGKQGDWNKIYGACFGLFGIHKTSVRFGWRYSIPKNCIELCTIAYINGKPFRDYLPLCDLELGESKELRINVYIDDYKFLHVQFYVGKQLVKVLCWQIKPRFYFGCGFYFGGESKAPHKITARIDKRWREE